MARFRLLARRGEQRAFEPEECASETTLQAAIARRIYDPLVTELRVERVSDAPVDDPSTVHSEAPGPSTSLIG